MKKFKIGDFVYYPRFSRNLCKIKEQDGYIGIYENKYNRYIGSVVECDLWSEVGSNDLCFESKTQVCEIIHATAENHTLLEKLYSVKFEAPPAPKNPKEIIQAMLDDGWIGVACYVNDTDKRPSKHNKKDLIVDIRDVNDGYIFGGNAYNWKGANPFDPKTGKIIIDYVDGEIVTE